MTDRQEVERKHNILTPQLGTGTLTVSLAKASHLANLTLAGPLPTVGYTAEACGKGHGCAISTSGREKSSGNNNLTWLSILRTAEIHAMVSRRAVDKMIQ